MPREPIRTAKAPSIPALASLGAHLSAGLVAAVLTAVAGSIVLVAASFAVYAALKGIVSPAAASALTALSFAVVAGAIAVIAPAVIRARASQAQARTVPARPALDAGTVRIVAEIALALVGGLAETALRRRAAAPKPKYRRR